MTVSVVATIRRERGLLAQSVLVDVFCVLDPSIEATDGLIACVFTIVDYVKEQIVVIGMLHLLEGWTEFQWLEIGSS